jgi:hypothetical protein
VDLFWPDPFEGPWRVTVHLAEVDGRLECVGIDLRSFGEAPAGTLEPTALNAELWRSFPPAQAIAEAQSWMRPLAGAVRAGKPGFAKDPRAKEVLARAAELVTRGRDGLGVDHFLNVAVVYADTWASGGGDPVAAVTDHWGCARSTAGRWVSQARRKYGYLEPTTPRRPNGRLTPKARRLIEKRTTDAAR